jgi:protoporphyrinogen oxidase
VLVYLRVAATPRFPEQWVYVLDRRYRPGRVTNFGSFRPGGAVGPSTVSAELWCDAGDGTWTAPDEELVAAVVADLGALGLVAPGVVRDAPVVRVPVAFPVPARGSVEALQPAAAHLASLSGISATGRWGDFTNGGVHDGLRAGMAAAEAVLRATPAPLGSPG